MASARCTDSRFSSVSLLACSSTRRCTLRRATVGAAAVDHHVRYPREPVDGVQPAASARGAVEGREEATGGASWRAIGEQRTGERRMQTQPTPGMKRFTRVPMPPLMHISSPPHQSMQVLPPSGHARSRSSSPMLLHPGSTARAAGIIGSGTAGAGQSGGQQPPQATPAIHGQTTSAPTAPLKRSGSPGAEPTSTSTAATKPASSSSSLRGAVWKVLLGVTGIDAREYVSLLSRGPSRCAGRISTDLPRTLKGDPTVQALSDARTRLLNAFAHWAEDEAARLRQAHAATAAAPSAGDDPQQQRQPAQPGHRPSLSSSAHAAPVHIPEVVTSGYQQGMGSLAAVLLFVLPEVDAFAAFRQLVTHGIPGLYESSLAGVREGCGLADDVLAVVDPDVRSHLIDVYGPASSHAELMFYSRIAALYANRPPLEHVVRIWDCCFAFGAHLVVLLCAAECVLRRRELLEAGRDAITRFQGIGDAKDSSPAANAPGTAAGPRLLDADQLVVVALELVQHLPPDLYQRLTAFSMRMSAPGVALDEAYRHQQLKQHQLDVQNEAISVSRPSVFTTRQGWGAAADPRDRDGHGRAIATAAASSSASRSTGITAASDSGETDFDVGAGSSMESTGRPEAVHDQGAGGPPVLAQSLLQRKQQHQESQSASGSGSGSVTLPPPPTHAWMGGSGSKLLPATLPRPGTAGAGSSSSSAGAGASVAPSVAYRQRAGTTAPAAGIRASATGSSQSTTSSSTSAHGVGSYSGGMHAKSPLAQWANAPPIASPSAGGASCSVGAARRPSASAVITGSHARIASGNGSSANTVSPSPGGYQYSYSYGLGRRSPANAAASTPGAGVAGGSSSASSASSGKGAAVGPSSSFARRREYQKALDEARRSGQPLLLHATLWSPSQHASTPGPAGTSTGASGGLTHGRRSSHGSVGSVHAAAAPAAGHHGHGIAASGWIPPQLPPLGPHASVSAGAALVEIMSSAGTRTTGPSTATTTAAPTMGAGTARLRAGTGGSPSPPSVAGSVGSASADVAAGTGSRAASRGPALEDDVARAPGYASEPADHGSAAASASAFASAPPLSPAGKTTSSSPPPSSLGIGIIPSASAAAHAHAHCRSSGSGSEATAAVPDARHQHRRSGGDSSSGDNKARPAASGVARRGYSHGHDGGHLHGHRHHGHRSRGGGSSGSQVHDIGSGSTAIAGGGGGTSSLVGSLSQAMADAILAHEAFRGIPGKDMDEDTALRRLQERRKQAAGVPVQGAVAASEASSGTHTPDATVAATGALPADAMHSAPAAASTTSWCWDPDTSDGLHPTDRSDTSSSLSSAAPGAVLTPPLAHLQHRILAGMGIGKPDAHGQQLHMLPDRLLATGCIGSRVGDGDAHITGQHAAATPSASSVVEHPDAETGHTSPCTAPAPPASASSSSQLAPSASPPPQPALSSASHDMLTSPVYQGVSMVPQDEKNEYDSAASRTAGGGESTPSTASGKGSSAASATGTGTPAAAGGGHQRVGSGGSSASSRRSRRNVSGASSTSSHGRNLSAIADEVLGLLEAEGEAAAGTSGPQLVDVDTGRVSLPAQPPASSSSAAAAQLTAVANSQP